MLTSGLLKWYQLPMTTTIHHHRRRFCGYTIRCRTRPSCTFGFSKQLPHRVCIPPRGYRTLSPTRRRRTAPFWNQPVAIPILMSMSTEWPPLDPSHPDRPNWSWNHCKTINRFPFASRALLFHPPINTFNKKPNTFFLADTDQCNVGVFCVSVLSYPRTRPSLL